MLEAKRAGATKRALAERYGISLSSVKRLSRNGGVNGQVSVSAGGHVKVPAPCAESARFQAASSSVACFAHAVALAIGDYDVTVVE